MTSPTTTSAAALAENERMAASGERVMVVARRDFDPDQFDPDGDLLSTTCTT